MMLVILVLVIMGIFVAIYMFTSKSIIEMQRLEGVLRSPMFIHFDQTLMGISTIRSENGQYQFKQKLIDKIKNNTMSYYTTFMTKLWFLQRMDFIGTFVIVLTITVLVLTKLYKPGAIKPATAGTALTNLTNVTTNINVIGLSLIEIETAMQSTERVLEIKKLKNEESEEVIRKYKKPPMEWPIKGEIKLENFKYRYRKNLPLVLKGIDASITDKEKIGVVGRTGSGKSTLMASLFRIEEPAGGKIYIDGIDITSIPLPRLRQSMCILPQEATMFSGTVRSNLDPFGKSSDERMIEVLKLVNSPCSLDDEVAENGDNFSLGQKQMICLARALLKNSKIFIMDEATANIDIQTDKYIQEMVKQNFDDVTIITVAHRLQTIMDYDRVMVFDHGNLMESDTPYSLIEREDSIFHSLVEQSGCAEELKRIAKDKAMGVNDKKSDSSSSLIASDKENNEENENKSKESSNEETQIPTQTPINTNENENEMIIVENNDNNDDDKYNDKSDSNEIR